MLVLHCVYTVPCEIQHAECDGSEELGTFIESFGKFVCWCKWILCSFSTLLIFYEKQNKRTNHVSSSGKLAAFPMLKFFNKGLYIITIMWREQRGWHMLCYPERRYRWHCCYNSWPEETLCWMNWNFAYLCNTVFLSRLFAVFTFLKQNCQTLSIIWRLPSFSL